MKYNCDLLLAIGSKSTTLTKHNSTLIEITQFIDAIRTSGYDGDGMIKSITIIPVD